MKKDEELLNETAMKLREILKQRENDTKNRIEGLVITPVWADGIDIGNVPAGTVIFTQDVLDNSTNEESVSRFLRVQKSSYNMMYKYQEKTTVDLYNSMMGVISNNHEEIQKLRGGNKEDEREDEKEDSDTDNEEKENKCKTKEEPKK